MQCFNCHTRSARKQSPLFFLLRQLLLRVELDGTTGRKQDDDVQASTFSKPCFARYLALSHQSSREYNAEDAGVGAAVFMAKSNTITYSILVHRFEPHRPSQENLLLPLSPGIGGRVEITRGDRFDLNSR